VSAFPVDGTWPTATAKWEKRNIALEIPVWDSKVCIQCNQCALVCPHAAIRAKVYDESALQSRPTTFKATAYRGNEYKGKQFTIQVAPEDCTGCNLCVNVCPAKDRTNPKHKAINMAPQAPLREAERANYDFFLGVPELDRTTLTKFDHKSSQLLEPLFEYSGACAGCGETPYLKLLTQLFGDRLLMANATGYDILQTVAAYNGGPQMVARTQGVVGPTADSLLVVESMPYYETRAYVQKVMAAYWSYRRQFGAATPTLDAAASGARTVDARLDR